MSWLELGWSFFAFDRHLSLNRLLRVFFIEWELTYGFVVACAGWVRWLERFVMLDHRSCLNSGLSMGNRHAFFEDLTMGVESVLFLAPL